MGDRVLGPEARRVGRQVVEKILHLLRREGVVFGVPLLGVPKALAEERRLLGLMAELVVEELVQEHLHDDLVLVAAVAEAMRRAGLLEGVDQVLRRLLDGKECLFHGKPYVQ